MTAPRTTRLVRVVDVQAFRDAVARLAAQGAPAEIRDRLVIVPTRAAAAHLTATMWARARETCRAIALPDFATARELVQVLSARLPPDRPALSAAEREVLLGVSCRAVRDAGFEPPFRLRPGLLAEMLAFYDSLVAHQRDVDAFERLALGVLEPAAAYDRGAERLVRQTQFLVAAFRDFERRAAAAGSDERDLARRLASVQAPRPYRHVIVAVGDRADDPMGLTPAQWDLLARLPGLQRLDVVQSDACLAGAPHERIHRLLPGIEEVRADDDGDAASGPVLVVPARRSSAGDAPPRAAVEALVHVARDREEEVAMLARRIRHGLRSGAISSLDRVAIVVRQPLPYVYVARTVLREAGIPCQMFDSLPLAAEPYAAALDLVLSAVSAAFARVPVIELLRSPHFVFPGVSPSDVAALDRGLAEAGFLGGPASFAILLDRWQNAGSRSVRRAASALRDVMVELDVLRQPAPAGDHLSVLLAFLSKYDVQPAEDDPLRERLLRARRAVHGILAALRDAYRRFDDQPVAFDTVAATIRRWIDAHTFAPREGDGGVHVVDAASARFGSYDVVHLAGLVDGEWPGVPRRNVFYSPGLLRELGWPSEADRLEGERTAFSDLLRLPSRRLTVSRFRFESDAVVARSPFLEDLERAGLPAVEEPVPAIRIFEHEVLGSSPVATHLLPARTRDWAGWRATRPDRDPRQFQGFTEGHAPVPWGVGAIERYLDCPFRFFAADVLRLREEVEDQSRLTPLERGRLLHEVCRRFFERWDQSGGGLVAPGRVDEARRLFVEVAEPLLAALGEPDATFERLRLFGSAISMGVVDILLGVEVRRTEAATDRLLEHALHGEFSLGAHGARVALRGVADRVDLLPGRRLRVVDYKSGAAPDRSRALQAAVYALCARERLGERGLGEWEIAEAEYVAFGSPRPVTTVAAGERAAEALDEARQRLFGAVAAIGRGEFPPRPHDTALCRNCAYPAVCRKEYVGRDA